MGAGLNLSPLYGRAPSNQRVYDEAPVARGQRISMVGAMTSSGMKTALNFEGTMTGLVFLYFLKHFLWKKSVKVDFWVKKIIIRGFSLNLEHKFSPAYLKIQNNSLSRRNVANYSRKHIIWLLVKASIPNIKWHMTLAGPRTRTTRPPNSSFILL